MGSSLRNFIDFIVKPTVSLEYRLEILKSINILLEHCAFSLRHTLLNCDDFVQKLCCLFELISNAGDYEFQVCAIECIFRLIPKPQRAEILERQNHSSSVTKLLLSIRDGHFETDCRVVLNKINAQNTSESSRVFSFPTESVKMDGEKIFKPSDDDYDVFWIDFNTGSKRISLFIEPNMLQSQEGEILWETISLWRNEVSRCDCTNQGNLWKAVIELKPGAMIYNSKDPDGQSHLFVIHVSTAYPFQDALLGTFGDSSKIMSKGQQKVSSVPSPLSISIEKNRKDISIVNKDSNSSVKSSCHNRPLNGCETPSQQTRSGAKTSVPMVPMRTPASSVISSQSQESMWNKIQDTMKKHSNEEKSFESDSLPRKDMSTVNEGSNSSVKASSLNDCETWSQQTRSSAKTSVPIKPMNTLTGSVISSQGQELTWHKTQVKKKKYANEEKSLESDSLSQDKIVEVSLEEDHGKLEKLKSKCSGTGPLVETNVISNLIEHQKRTFPRDKLSAKSNEKNIGGSFKVTDENIQSYHNKHMESISEDSANVINSKESVLEKDAQFSISNRIYPNMEENDSCPLRRSQRNVKKNVESMAEEEKRQTDTKNKSTRMEDVKNQKKLSNLNNRQASSELEKSIKTNDKNTHTVGETGSKESKTPPQKSCRSTKKVKTPVVTVEKSRKTTESRSKIKHSRIKEDSLVITTLTPDLHGIRHEGSPNVHKNKLVQEPTVTSVDEEKKEKTSRHMKGQQEDTTPKPIQAEILKSLISPGCISEEDFKHPRVDLLLKRPEKGNGKDKSKKKNQIIKSTSDIVVFTPGETQNSCSFEEEREFSTGKNLREKKSKSNQKGSKGALNILSNKKESKEYATTYANKSLIGQDHSKDDNKLSSPLDKLQVSEKTSDERREYYQDLAGLSKDHGLNYDKLDSSKKANSKDENQGDIFKERNKDGVPQSHTKSGIKDSSVKTNHTISQVIFDIHESESQIYKDNEKESKKGTTKNSDKHKTMLSLNAEVNHCQKDMMGIKGHKNNHASKAVGKTFSFDDVSSSNSGFLFIESQMENNFPVDVINETQCDKLTPQYLNIPNTTAGTPDDFNSSPPIEPTQGLENRNLKMHKLRKLSNEKIPKSFGFEENELNASGDFHIHNTEPQTSSNMESSYVFNKCGSLKKTVSKHKVKDIGEASQDLIDLNKVQYTKTRDDNMKKGDPQNLYGTQCKNITNKNHVNMLSLPVGGCGDGLRVSDTHENNHCGRKLRERNKKIQYKECESSEPSPKKSIFTNLSPAADKRKSQKDPYTMKMAGFMAPKKAPKENRQKKTFWTSREIKTTVTTTSYSKMINSKCSTDPYNFETECTTTSTEGPLLPFRSFNTNKSNSQLKHSKDKLPDREKHKKAQERGCDTTYDRTSAFDHMSHVSKKSFLKKSKSLKNKGKKKACSKESVEFSLFSSQKSFTQKNQSKGSTKTSMEFALFSSQKDQLQVSPDSGLVFPPLDDSIPCTPYDQADGDSVASEGVIENSRSECSWMKSKTPLTVKEKMRGKTYNKLKGKHTEQKADVDGDNTEDEIEYGHLYQRLHDKQLQKRPVDPMAETPQRSIVLDRLETEKTPRLCDPYKSLSWFKEGNNSIKNKLKKTVSSILTNSSGRSKNNSNKKSKRSLSFKSPSDDDHQINDAQSDHESHLAASWKNLKSPLTKDMYLKIPSLSCSEMAHTRKKHLASEDFSKNLINSPWEVLTSKLDHQILGVLDKNSGCLDPSKHPLKAKNSICSGPSSIVRPRRSFLKRKYAEQISSCSDNEGMSGSDSEQLESISMPKSLKLDSPLLHNAKSFVNDICKTPRTPKKKLFSALSFDDFSPLNLKMTTPVRTPAQIKKSPKKLLNRDVSPKKKKRKSQRKLELSPFLPRPTRFESNAVKSVPSFDIGSWSSPEKGRDCSQLKSKIESGASMSPYLPLSLSITGSHGLSPLSSPDQHENIDANELEIGPGPAALLDTIKDDLLKPLISQQSEGSSEDYCTQRITQSESSRSDMDHCGASHTTYSSLRDLLTRKDMKKPSLVSEVEDATRQTVRCISSKWDDEQRK
ncbi:hypothetical protein EGW08_000881, partial [Elysia chlorotica]